jgi:hypothetical protein
MSDDDIGSDSGHDNDNDDAWLESATFITQKATLGAMLAEVVGGMLTPALAGQKVQSCLHIMDSLLNDGILPVGTSVASEKLQALICPFHTDRLICNICVGEHVEHTHKGFAEQSACFLCSTPWREDFEGVNARVQLLEPISFYDDNRARGRWFTFSGELWTLPLVWLCPRHKDAMGDLPWQMTWPTTMSGNTPVKI